MWELVKNIILFIGIIVLLHYFYNYVVDNYSNKNTKDLIETQTQKYKNILNEVLETQNKNYQKQHIYDNDTQVIDEQNMENELISMVQSQLG
jgi:hypothetical protein